MPPGRSALQQMAILYSIDPERRLVETRISGETNLAEVEDHIRRLAADPAYRPDYDSLVDLTETPTLFTAEELRSIADFVRDRMPAAQSRRAVVAGTEVAFGLMRMYEAFTEDMPRSFCVFRNPSDARAWLGLATRGADAH